MSEGQHYDLPSSGIEVYEQHIVPGVMAPFARGLIEAAGIERGNAILDVACGTGIVARLAQPLVGLEGKVVGIDLNSAMLVMAAQIATRDRLPIEWREGNAESLPFEQGSFDVALCQHGLQYFSDRLAVLKEIHRILKPGGQLVANVWRPVQYNPGHYAFANALERHVSDVAAAERRAPFAFSNAKEIRSVIAEAGYRDVRVMLDTRVARFPSPERMIQIMMAGSPLANILREKDASAMHNVVAEVSNELAAYQDDIGLALPMQAWIVTAYV